MARLYFRYGTVSSGKTLHLLMTAHNYERLGKKALVAKPEFDTRFGYGIVKTRVGLERQADVLLQENPHYINVEPPIACLLVDEAQFVTPEWIDYFRELATLYNAPIICYGLKTDFKSQLFPAAQRLIEVADVVQEIETVCAKCGDKATMNLKQADGVPVFDGPSVELGAEEKYLPHCWACYYFKRERQDQEG